jgi:hypothetical protein
MNITNRIIRTLGMVSILDDADPSGEVVVGVIDVSDVSDVVVVMLSVVLVEVSEDVVIGVSDVSDVVVGMLSVVLVEVSEDVVIGVSVVVGFLSTITSKVALTHLELWRIFTVQLPLSCLDTPSSHMPILRAPLPSYLAGGHY